MRTLVLLTFVFGFVLVSSPAAADFEITDFSDTTVELTFPDTPDGPENSAEIVGRRGASRVVLAPPVR